MSTDLQNVVITQLKLRVSRLLSPGPDRLTSTNQAMKYSPGQEVRKCETGRDKQGVRRDNKRLAYSERLGCVSNLCCLLLMEAHSYFYILSPRRMYGHNTIVGEWDCPVCPAIGTHQLLFEVAHLYLNIFMPSCVL